MSLLSRQTVENWAYNQESLENLQKKKRNWAAPYVPQRAVISFAHKSREAWSIIIYSMNVPPT
jgi:hypothetical protein